MRDDVTMKRVNFILLSSVLLVFGLVSCGDKPEPAPIAPPAIVLPAHYTFVTADEADKLLQSTPAPGVLDVRGDEEMRDGNGWIIGAVPCPQLQGNREKLATLDRKRPWFVYCAIGGRAELTAETMAGLGFEKVYLLKGGFIEWRAQGKPVVK